MAGRTAGLPVPDGILLTPMRLDVAIQFFLTEKRVYCAPATVEYYENMLHRFSLFFDSLGLSDTLDINQDVLQHYIFSLRSSVKSTSIHTYFRGIKQFCSWGILNGHIPPFDYRLKLPRPDPEQMLPLSTSEVNNCLEHIMYDDKILMFRLMLDCGLRSSEVLHLTMNDIDMDKRILFINRSKYDKSRMVPLPDRVLDLFSGRSDPLFSFDRSGKCSFFARLRKSTGIDRLHAHLLRHTFATSYMAKRGNLEHLRVIMGHSDYSVTKFYIQKSYECQLLGYDLYQIDDVFL